MFELGFTFSTGVFLLVGLLVIVCVALSFVGES